MTLRTRIETVFGGKAFLRPLFYAYPGGLRFELSEGGSAIEQFLTALRKATEVCKDVFGADETVVVCLRCRAGPTPFADRALLRQLKAAGIKVPRTRCLWLDKVPAIDQIDDDGPELWLNLAFEAPSSLLQNFLWCAFASDFGAISPRLYCDVYLIGLQQGVLMFPYDDRGMDVVGPNHAALARLYSKYGHYLLDYDRKAMDAAFSSYR